MNTELVDQALTIFRTSRHVWGEEIKRLLCYKQKVFYSKQRAIFFLSFIFIFC